MNISPGSVVSVVNPSTPVKVTQQDPTKFVVNTPGIPGPAGTPGGGGFVWHQTSAAGTWSVTHTLGRAPLSIMVTVSNAVVLADITINGTTQVVVTFATPQTGYLYLS